MGGQRPGEIGDGLGLGEQADLDPAAAFPGQGGVTAARGDQGAAVRAGRRPQTAKIVGVGDVVQDDQPPAWLRCGLGGEPGQESPGSLFGIVGVGLTEFNASLRIAGHQRGAGARGSPDQHVQLVARALVPGGAGIVGGELCFADSAHTGQDLAQHSRAAGAKYGLHPLCLGAVLEGLSPGRDHSDLVRQDGRLTARMLLHHSQLLRADLVDIAGVGEPSLGGEHTPGRRHSYPGASVVVRLRAAVAGHCHATGHGRGVPRVGDRYLGVYGLRAILGTRLSAYHVAISFSCVLSPGAPLSCSRCR